MEFDITTTAAFTGHRPQRIGGFDPLAPQRIKVRKALWEAIQSALHAGYRTFISGMALGVDQDAAVLVDYAKTRFPLWRSQIRLVAAIPCVGQETKWPQASRNKYHEILEMCDERAIVSEGLYREWKMHTRNEWMVDRSSRLIAVWDGKDEGGTARCVAYAQQRKDLTIVQINPHRW